MGAQLTEVIRCLNVLETDRTGSSSYRIYEAYDVRQMSRVVQDDLERVFAAMARSTSSILIDDICDPLKGVFDAINLRYAQRIVGEDKGSTIFSPRRRPVSFVRPDFLLRDGARDAILRLYDTIAAAPRASLIAAAAS